MSSSNKEPFFLGAEPGGERGQIIGLLEELGITRRLEEGGDFVFESPLGDGEQLVIGESEFSVRWPKAALSGSGPAGEGRQYANLGQLLRGE